MPLHPDTSQQIESIKLIKNRPLIICDVDEVLVHFAKPLEKFLNSHNMSIAFTSYKLFGNVYFKDKKEKVPKAHVLDLLQSFFSEEVHTCPPVEGVHRALDKLSQHYQITIVTNTPLNARALRIQALKNIGIDFPLVANDGHKGPAVQTLCATVKAPVVFLDDIPHHHSSVAKEAPHVHRIHFVADPKLAKLLDPAPDSHKRIDNWPEAEIYIDKYFSEFEGKT